MWEGVSGCSLWVEGGLAGRGLAEPTGHEEQMWTTLVGPEGRPGGKEDPTPSKEGCAFLLKSKFR